MQDFAKNIIVYEVGGHKASGGPCAIHACEKLRPHLATLMGVGGFRALLSRSLALASAEIQGLSALRVKADGTFEGLEDLQAQLKDDKIIEGGVILLAHLLGLLKAFIGESLTIGLAHEVWPQVPFLQKDSDRGSKMKK
jgi:hypothetical protein